MKKELLPTVNTSTSVIMAIIFAAALNSIILHNWKQSVS